MADSTTIEALTNTTPQSCVDVKCDCNAMWSMAQQFSYLRLSDAQGNFKATLVKNYVVRANRIAATYARFYLELEEGADTAKKGRFYWAALAAFASKTVACTLALRRVRYLSTISDGLAKGNLWLFSDICGWHWYYMRYPGSFEQCLDSRNAENFVSTVKAQLKKLPWSAEALPKVRNFAVSKEIRAGFAKVKEFENQSRADLRQQIQLDHLLAIADHEQGVILQPLIYNDPDFTKWLARQRNLLVRLISPDLELVFSSTCATDDGTLKSMAPDDTELENFKSRMKWITSAADKFHQLMQKKKPYMEGEIQKVAGWVAAPDK